MFITVFISCIVLGAVVGFLAGLLGIGGGLVIVPALVYLLPMLGIDQSVIMPMALATSLATIVITSSTAAYSHHKNGNIPWDLAKILVAFVAVGALLGAYIADNLSAKSLALIFSIAVILLAIYMLRSIRKIKNRPLPSHRVLRSVGVFTGCLASLMGISGGAILIPTLTYFGMQLRHTIGVATACGMVVALFGSLGYIFTGWHNDHLPSWSLGYIYLPALLGIVLSSSLFARVGVKQAKKLPVRTLKKLFSFFLIIVAIKMISSEVL
jgi:hypothetical protein